MTTSSNISAMTTTFDFRGKSLIYRVRLRRDPGAAFIQQRAEAKDLLRPDSVVQVSARRALTGGIIITLSGPGPQSIYRALPALDAQLSALQVDALIREYNRMTDTKITTTVRNLDRIILELCQV